ncbi:nucleotide exchange factor GrpE [Magnetospirillum fulvum]|uniref:Protein GrpE n=1 Tax=Magnetospirillum fulvum TaxID=1082 RepID=A0A1H6GYF9_MAGFU|nr:nucleotide exchange factor GrpE [Magnetospirillum fulvum]SEH27078.1 molecular chaperone GrpE [Magnetospirillum fulvum]
MTQDQTSEQPVDTSPVDGAEAAPSEAPVAEAAEPAPADRIAELEAQVAKLKNDVLYARADTENVRRRLEQQAEDRGKYAVSTLAKDVLSVADNLRRALDAVPPGAREADEAVNSLTVGVEMTERELIATFERYGIRKVPAMGERFDPNLHQAMMEIEDAAKLEGTVVLEMQSGYTLHDRLLRPALVGIAKGGPKSGGGNLDTSA